MSDKNLPGETRERLGPTGWTGARQSSEATRADDRALEPRTPRGRAATVFEPVLAPVWRHFRPASAKKPLAIYKLVFYLTVVIPTAIAALYYGAIATDRYVSVAEMAVRSADEGASPSSGTSSLLSGLLGTSSSAQQSSFILQDYVQSRQVVDTLQKKIDLRQLWSVGSADFLSRLRGNATDEDLYNYFQDHVSVAYDPGTGLTTIAVEAFNAVEAQKIAWAIVSLSDDLINSIDQKAQKDVVRFAENEVTRYQGQLESAQLALQDFRNKHREIDLETGAAAVGTLVAQIDQTLSQDRGQLTAMRQFLKDDAPQIQALKAQIQSLESQLQAEKRRLGVPSNASNQSPGATYADALTQFKRLQIEEGFANTAYTAALTELVNAHAAAVQKHLYLVPFVAPSLPQACNRLTLFCDSIEPKRTVAIATVLACGLVGFGILSLLIAAVREHVRL